MNRNIVIRANKLCKHYTIFESAQSRLAEWLSCGLLKRSHKHQALYNISFEVSRGECIGIIGKNGSGKSTLLKLLSGVIEPSTGNFYTSGSVLSLLELGTGVNPELTGRQNIIYSAQLLNLDAQFLKSIIYDVETFADIGEYFDHPVKMYSSGMYIRLAMSIYLHMKPDIFIIDEALSVGDIFFQQKCFKKIQQMMQAGTTFILVSHDISLITKITHRVMLITDGRLEYFGDKKEACSMYYNNYSLDQPPLPGDQKNGQAEAAKIESIFSKTNLLKNRYPDLATGATNILALRVTDNEDRDCFTVEQMGSLNFYLQITAQESIQNQTLSISLKDNLGQLITVIFHDLITAPQTQVYCITIPFTIQPGEYSFDIGIGQRQHENANTGSLLFEVRDLGPIVVFFDYERKKAPFHGLTYLKTSCRILS